MLILRQKKFELQLWPLMALARQISQSDIILAIYYLKYIDHTIKTSICWDMMFPKKYSFPENDDRNRVFYA